MMERCPRSLFAQLWADQSGASMLEYALLVAVIAIPLYLVFVTALNALMGHYAMMTFLNGWPFP